MSVDPIHGFRSGHGILCFFVSVVFFFFLIRFPLPSVMRMVALFISSLCGVECKIDDGSGALQVKLQN